MRSLILVAALSMGAVLPGCLTNPETGEREVDPARLKAELELAAADFHDAGTLAGEGGTGIKLEALSVATYAASQSLSDWIAAGSPGESRGAVVAVLDGLLEETEPLLGALVEDPEAEGDVRLLAFAARAALRRVKAYL